MKRRSLLAGLFALAGFAAVPAVQAVQAVGSDRPCRKPLTVTAVSEKSVLIDGEKEDVKRFLHDWQTAVWPTWQTDLNDKGTNLAIKQVNDACADIDAGKPLMIYNGMDVYHHAIGVALAKHFAKCNS